MAEIIIPKRWKRPPDGIAGVDWGNAIAQGLELLFYPAAGRVNLAKKNISSDVWTRGIRQDGVTATGTGSNDFSFGGAGVDASKPVSVFTRGTILDINSRRVFGTSAVSFQHSGAPGVTLQATYIGVADYNSTATVDLYNGAYGSAFYSTGATIIPATTGGLVFYAKGRQVGNAVNTGTPTSGWNTAYLFAQGFGNNRTSNYASSVIALWNRALSAAEHAALDENPWQLAWKPGRVFFLPSAGGGGATGTGAPAAQSSTVSGTATRTITGTGTPSAQASTVAGTAEREITGSGAPVSQDATVAGTGSVSAGISGSGVLSAQSATVAGTATRTVTASGTPSAQGATVAGTAEREVTGSGTSSAQSATVVGTGQIGNIVTGSGAPAAQSATVAGTAEREITSSGAVSAQSATVAGAGVRVITGTGSPTAQDATVYGYDVAPQTAHNTGGGGSRKMLLSERKVRDEVDEWLKKKREQEMLARIQREDEELVLILALVA